MDLHRIKINLPGGIVSPGDLSTILSLAGKRSVADIRFGTRQQLLFRVQPAQLAGLAADLEHEGIFYETDRDDFPNIVSSYVTSEVFQSPNWLREGVYKDILDSFTHRPQLKINIVDYFQNLIPFFSGNLNFISSDVSNFWHLYVRFPKSNTMFCWPSLVYTEDIPGISEAIEQLIAASPERYYYRADIDGLSLHAQVKASNRFLERDIEQPLTHTDFQLPYYEGFNRYGDRKLWLGIYRRDEDFPVSLLQAICGCCIETRVGQLYTTSWKSIVIKNIDPADRNTWSSLLDAFRINARHAANELNWQLEDWCDEALDLKRSLVRAFEEADLRTYRLCFAIKTKPRTGLFGSVVIRKHDDTGQAGKPLYEVLHTRNFNPNSKEYVSLAESVGAGELPDALIRVCDAFYASRIPQKTGSTPPPPALAAETLPVVFQCRHCLTVYDQRFGDLLNGVLPGTPFADAADYRCPTCEAPKTDFVLVDEEGEVEW